MDTVGRITLIDLAPVREAVLRRVSAMRDYLAEARLTQNPWGRDRNIARVLIECDVIESLLVPTLGPRKKEEEKYGNLEDQVGNQDD